MERGFKNLLSSQGYNHLQKRFGIALAILIIALILFSSYFFLYYTQPVATGQKFIISMSNCKSVSWIKEDDQASWLYVIKGRAGGNACNVEVQLLKMKEGSIGSEKLQGKKMICELLKGSTQFPEKDISRCTGELKEELQDIIIQRFHSYLLENVGEIKQEFSEV